MHTRSLWLFGALVIGCRGADKDGDAGEIGYTPTVDEDGDGWPDTEDCDDGDAAVNPGEVELCDGIDNDCNGEVDEGVQSVFYADADADGYGDEAVSVDACEAPPGHVADPTSSGLDFDCDDTEADTYPGAPERCDDLDNDCNGVIDDDLVETWYADADADGYGDPDAALDSCDPGDAYVADATDCDDGEASVYPGADEWCNGADDDCDGTVDEDDALDAATWYADTDADGFGDLDSTTAACEAPEGFTADATDCDDTLTEVNPAADELCDGIDNDCDGTVDEDEAIDAGTWYADGDGDGYGDPDSSTVACEQPSGYGTDATDCDDGDDDVHPWADESCNGEDDDCDGTVDEDDATDASTWYADGDGDGYGDIDSSMAACDQPSGYTDNADDCDDGTSDVSPDADELCNEIDDDCDGDVDESDATDATTWYGDADSDGYGGSLFTTTACDQPSGFVDNTSDCDDLDGDIHPAATEVCDEADNDCDGTTDEDDASDASTWTVDSDGDGYGEVGGATTAACDEPSGYAESADDCDDADDSIHPDATEDCNGVDDDCDGAADNGVIGEDSTCAAGSCLEVLEDGSPTASDYFWLDDGGGAVEVYCDFGTVGGGWAYRLELEIDNATGRDLSDEWVAVELDTETLVDDGKLEGDGLDLRAFTHDGPLMDYWFAGIVGEGTTTIWMQVPELPASTTTDFTLTYGNADTERKSLSWWFDGFDSDTSDLYDTDYASSWGTPAWTWDTSDGVVETDSTNMDYFLVVDDTLLTLDEPVYIEAKVTIYDNDAIGPMLVESGGSYVTATASDDYDGVAHAGGQECILENTSVPSAHYQGSYLLELGDLESPNGTVVGMSWDGADLAYVLDGTEEGSVSLSGYTFTGVGLSTYANSGIPGADVEYLFVGPEPIDFDPEGLSSDATAATGSESAF